MKESLCLKLLYNLCTNKEYVIKSALLYDMYSLEKELLTLFKNKLINRTM